MSICQTWRCFVDKTLCLPCSLNHLGLILFLFQGRTSPERPPSHPLPVPFPSLMWGCICPANPSACAVSLPVSVGSQLLGAFVPRLLPAQPFVITTLRAGGRQKCDDAPSPFTIKPYATVHPLCWSDAITVGGGIIEIMGPQKKKKALYSLCFYSEKPILCYNFMYMEMNGKSVLGVQRLMSWICDLTWGLSLILSRQPMEPCLCVTQ